MGYEDGRKLFVYSGGTELVKSFTVASSVMDSTGQGEVAFHSATNEASFFVNVNSVATTTGVVSNFTHLEVNEDLILTTAQGRNVQKWGRNSINTTIFDFNNDQEPDRLILNSEA